MSVDKDTKQAEAEAEQLSETVESDQTGEDAGGDQVDEQVDAEIEQSDGEHEPENADEAQSENNEDAGEEESMLDDESYEVVELEITDDDIVCYLEDEEGSRVGFVLLEDGEEVEYFYVEDEEDECEEEPPRSSKKKNEFDLGITKEGVKEVTGDANAIYQDGVAIASELKDAFVDIKDAFDFSFLKKK